MTSSTGSHLVERDVDGVADLLHLGSRHADGAEVDEKKVVVRAWSIASHALVNDECAGERDYLVHVQGTLNTERATTLRTT